MTRREDTDDAHANMERLQSKVVTQARENRIAFGIAVWLALVMTLICAHLVTMLFIGLPRWLAITMGVVAGLAMPPSLYVKLRDRSNIGIKRRPYRPELVGSLASANGDARASSWLIPTSSITESGFSE